MNPKFWQIAGGVGMVLAGGGAGYWIGGKFKHPNIGAGAGVGVAVAVNFALMQKTAAAAQQNPAQ